MKANFDNPDMHGKLPFYPSLSLTSQRKVAAVLPNESRPAAPLDAVHLQRLQAENTRHEDAARILENGKHNKESTQTTH